MKCTAKFAALSVLGMATLAGAFQPPGGVRPDRPIDRPAERRPPGEQPPTDREGMKAFIQRRLEDLRLRTEALDRALKRLDEGADPAAVREDVESPRGGGRRGAGGPGDRFGGPDEQMMPPAQPLPPLSPEQTLKLLDEVAPRMAARVRQFAASNPEFAERMIGRMRGKLDELRGIREHDPALFRLKAAEMQGAYAVMETMRKFRGAVRENASPEEAGRLREELKTAVGEHFDQQLAVQQHEVERLTERLEKLQSEIKDRQQGRDRIIERQVDEAVASHDRAGPGDRERRRTKPD